MADFYHIMLQTPGLSPDDERVLRKMNLALDWYRYTDECWVVYTSSNAAKWYERLKPLIEETDGRVFIAKFDVKDRSGWVAKGLWDFLRKQR